MGKSDPIQDVGVVVIGRNEGDRFIRCLKSLADWQTCLVYVDSGSTDGSVKVAHKADVSVVELDPTISFTAARARNEGIKSLLKYKNYTYVQFVDGDCEIAPGWINSARQYLLDHPDVAAVGGHLQEKFPANSIYNRLCAIEWNTPKGEVKALGGIGLFCVDDFLTVGGFNSTLIAGEEPELCLRIRQNGKKIMRIDEEMAKHDADILTFQQWWKRMLRSGYGSLDVVTRLSGKIPKKEIPYYHMVHSIHVWTISWVIGTLLLAFIYSILNIRFGVVIGLLSGIAVWIIQAVRIGWGVRLRAQNFQTALFYGFFTLIGKWAQFIGQQKYKSDSYIK